MRVDWKLLLRFLLLVPLFSWPLGTAFGFASHAGHGFLALLLSAGGMAAAGVGSYVATRARPGALRSGWRWPGPGMLLVSAAIGAALWLPGLLLDMQRGVLARPTLVELGKGALVIPIYLVGAFGEELTWRGFLLPALRPLGARVAVLLTGVVWGVWHLPWLATPLLLNTALPLPVRLAGLVGISASLLVLMVPASALFAWLFERTRSLAAVTLLHASYDWTRDAMMHPNAPGHGPMLAPAICLGLTLLAAIALFVQGRFGERGPDGERVVPQPVPPQAA